MLSRTPSNLDNSLQMSQKVEPLGICDFCKGPIPRQLWYTSKGKPRLYCSRDCRNTANSRAGASIRSVKQKERVRQGKWLNPMHIRPPTPAEQAERARKGRLREIAEGRWRNPALDPAARAKLSQPRKHSGPLHRALEKLRFGSTADLTEEELQAHREYRRKLYRQRLEDARAWYREWYRKKMASLTGEEREELRARWRARNRNR